MMIIHQKHAPVFQDGPVAIGFFDGLEQFLFGVVFNPGVAEKQPLEFAVGFYSDGIAGLAAAGWIFAKIDLVRLSACRQ